MIKKPSFYELFKTALYIGVIGYGGAANLALMKKTFVDEKEWVLEHDFMDALSLAQIIPGSTGVSLMGYLGFKHYRLRGGILIPVAFMLPATAAIIILSWAYFRFGTISFVQALFAGLGAFVVALLANATWMMGRSVFKKMSIASLKGAVIGAITFVGIFFLNINPAYLIVDAGVLGFLFYYFTGEFEAEKAGGGEAILAEPARSSWRSLDKNDWIVLVVTVAILAGGLLMPVIRALIISFVSVGLLAFGGGFTAVPLIQHQVIDVHQWLTVRQFLDGIALGQVTPGPVLVTATFVGYKVAGILGALFATMAIFLVPIFSMNVLADMHAKIKELKIFKVAVKGFLAGFIGLLAAVTLQFALKSLLGWQAWLIFALAIIWLMVLKKNSAWAILGTIALSLILF